MNNVSHHTRPRIRRMLCGTLILTGACIMLLVGPSPRVVLGQHGMHTKIATPTESAALTSSAHPTNGLLDFALLRQTQLDQAPPPVFPDILYPLDGQKVRIRGFMVPFDDVKNLSKFMLMATSGGCFFCQPPSVSEVVYVERTGQQKHPYIRGPIEVEGTLRLWKEGSGWEMHQAFLFLLLDATVRELN